MNPAAYFFLFSFFLFPFFLFPFSVLLGKPVFFSFSFTFPFLFAGFLPGVVAPEVILYFISGQGSDLPVGSIFLLL